VRERREGGEMGERRDGRERRELAVSLALLRFVLAV
jgi:hypothetical protein